jgi:WD40 repeat protein
LVLDVGQGKGATCAAFSPDGREIAVGTGAATAYVFDTHTGKELCKWTCPDEVTSVAFSPDGRTLAVGVAGLFGGSGVFFYAVANGREVARLSQLTTQSLAFSPDGKLLASGDEVGEILVWDMKRVENGTGPIK